MGVENDVAEIVKRNLDVYYEIEAIDTEFRFDLDGDQRRIILPWGAVGPVEHSQAASEVWQKLNRGELSKNEAIAEMRELMTVRYGRT